MKPRVTFAVTEVGENAAAGDYFTAVELGKALHDRFGWEADYCPKSEGWYELSDTDLLIVMVDDYELPSIRNAKPSLLTIAWARNWFERWCTRSWIADYDMHLASSRRAVDFFSRYAHKRARLLRLATNPTRFVGESHSVDPSLDFVFTGSYWESPRDLVAVLQALPRKYRGAIYGKNWEQVPTLSYLNRGFLSYEKIHEIYRDAQIVIDDANHVTKAWGAANSRIFDALAAGCLVITNSRSVSDEIFGSLLPVYESSKDLERLIDSYLSNPGDRDSTQARLREIVMERHCYKHRAVELGVYLRSLGGKSIDAF